MLWTKKWRQDNNTENKRWNEEWEGENMENEIKKVLDTVEKDEL